MAEKTELFRILADGKLDQDVYLLLGPFSLSQKNRTFADLVKFLKITKGIKGEIKFYLDQESKIEFNEENYEQKKGSVLNGKLYFTAKE
jgi:hypothetical protein